MNAINTALDLAFAATLWFALIWFAAQFAAWYTRRPSAPPTPQPAPQPTPITPPPTPITRYAARTAPTAAPVLRTVIVTVEATEVEPTPTIATTPTQAIPAATDYTTLSAAELRAECKRHGIRTRRRWDGKERRLNKREMIEALTA